MILNQRRLSYDICKVFAYYLKCFACRRRESLKSLSVASKTDFYVNRGMDKLSRDLDIVNMLDIIRGFHVMKQVLFSFNDRFLLHL